MGRAIVALIDRELASTAEATHESSPVLAHRVREQFARREAEVADRKRSVRSIPASAHYRRPLVSEAP